MEHCRGSWTCLAGSQSGVCPLFQCSFCLQGLGAFGGLSAPLEAHVLTFSKQPGSLFDHFGVILGGCGSLWPPSRPIWRLSHQNVEKCAKMTPRWEPFWLPLAALGTLELHPGSPWSKNGAKCVPKLRFLEFVKMCVCFTQNAIF